MESKPDLLVRLRVDDVNQLAALRDCPEEGLNEGKLSEARRVLRLVGDEAFGPPDASTAALIDRLDDLARLDEFLKRVRTAESWRELLGQPGRRGKRRR